MENCEKHLEQYDVHDTFKREDVYRRGWKETLEWVKSWLTDSIDDSLTKYLINVELNDQPNQSSNQSTPDK